MMVRKPVIVALAIIAIAASAPVSGQTVSSALRGSTPLNEEGPAAPMTPMRNTTERETRNYPEQPPVIPHTIDGYQITLHTNQCLTCHARQFIEGSGAPMISVTHFMDRDGQVLADVGPRRYFCNACHVSQTDAQPLVRNTFRDALAR